MRRFILPAAGVCLLLAGCGERMLRTPGRVVKDGQTLVPKDGEALQVLFVPVTADGKPAPDNFAAVVDQADGTFRPAGKNLKGMPPGKYRVAVELKKNRKDVFGGKYDADKSPFVVTVDTGTPEIVIDLDNPPK